MCRVCVCIDFAGTDILTHTHRSGEEDSSARHQGAWEDKRPNKYWSGLSVCHLYGEGRGSDLVRVTEEPTRRRSLSCSV